MVQAIKPRRAEPDYHHPVEVDVELEVVQEEDLARFFGSFTATVDPANLTLTSWSAQSTREYSADSRDYYQVAGAGALPLDYTGSDYLRWNLDDQAVCDATTTIVQYTIRDGATDEEVLQWSCDGDSYFQFWIRDLE